MEPSIMWRYIHEEPEVLERLARSPQTDEFAKARGRGLRAVYFAAHGSSYNTAACAAEYFARRARIRAYAYTPGSFCGCPLPLEEPSGTLAVVISQTGTSAGALEALEHAAGLGVPTLGITAEAGSPLAQRADAVLDLCCGREESNAKTKGYSATLFLLLRLALSLGQAGGALGREELAACLEELARMARCIPRVVEDAVVWCQSRGIGKEMEDLYVLGSGMNLGAALEGQLKVMETMCIPTMWNHIGEFSHGMHRAVTEKSSLLLLREAGQFSGLTKAAYSYLRGITPHVWMIDATGEPPADENCLCVPAFPESRSLLLTTAAVQVLSVCAPEALGKDPNREANNEFTQLVKTRVC